VPYLYTIYHSVNNVRLEQCPSCRAPADPCVEHDALVIALDLILLKRGVYRHLLFNRDTPPRRVDERASRGHDDGPRKQPGTDGKQAHEDDDARERTRRWLLVRVGAGVVLVDSFVRWSRLRKCLPSEPTASGSPWRTITNDRDAAAVAFLRILLGCFVETTSFHGGITLASILVLTGLNWTARRRKCANPPSGIRQQLRHVLLYSHISLCLLYSSLTKFVLLVVLSIWEWGPQVPRNTDRSAYAYTMSLESPLWYLLDDDVLDRTWLVRNMLRGFSTGFGLRVVLDCHPFFTSLVLLSGYVIKTGVVSLVREFLGPSNGVDETWLAYSIP
ncbi:Arv1-like family-domain-containing protein, partial [Russula brevipes]